MPISDKVAAATKAQAKAFRLFDSHGLYLEISPYGHQVLAPEVPIRGKGKDSRIGVYSEVTLRDARLATDKARNEIRNGVDPSVPDAPSRGRHIHSAS